MLEGYDKGDAVFVGSRPDFSVGSATHRTCRLWLPFLLHVLGQMIYGAYDTPYRIYRDVQHTGLTNTRIG
jgi:hypothetical protein